MKRFHLLAAALALLLWTTFLAFMFRRETRLDDERIGSIALSQARSLFNQMEDLRSWNASHGGVYVETDERTPPNPYLEVPNRDVVTTDGVRLTLLNPAYMSHQIAEISRERRGIRTHLTSLEPLRPDSAPDAWERAALEGFARGEAERSAFTDDADGRAVFRYIAPLPVEAPCLRCHCCSSGYPVGAVRGGIAITYPAEALARGREGFARSVALATGVLWLLGAGLTAAVTVAFHHKQLLAARLADLALVDELTGLHNLRGFRVLAEKQLQIARRTGRPALLLFFDLDAMKLINDRHGHAAGDEALRRAAGILRATLRSSDIIARIGGDEFAALCPETGAEAAPAILDSLGRHQREAAGEAAAPWAVSLSAGWAVFDPGREVTLEGLVREADAAMYAAKQAKQEKRAG